MFGFFKKASYRSKCSEIFYNVASKKIKIELQQCVEFVEDSKVGYADDIRVSFNGQRSRSYKNARSWWKTSQEVCDAMFQ